MSDNYLQPVTPQGTTIRKIYCPRCRQRHYEISDVMFCPKTTARVGGAGMIRISGEWGRSGRVLTPVLDVLRRSLGVYYTRAELIELAYECGEFEPADADNCMIVFMSNLARRLKSSRLVLVQPGGGRRHGFKLDWRHKCNP